MIGAVSPLGETINYTTSSPIEGGNPLASPLGDPFVTSNDLSSLVGVQPLFTAPPGSPPHENHILHTMERGVVPTLPFIAILNLPSLAKLINDTIAHDPTWPDMLDKLPSYIPKFKGKKGG